MNDIIGRLSKHKDRYIRGNESVYKTCLLSSNIFLSEKVTTEAEDQKILLHCLTILVDTLEKTRESVSRKEHLSPILQVRPSLPGEWGRICRWM